MTPASGLAIAVTTTAVVVLLRAERTGRPVIRRAAKTTASLGFVGLGLAQAASASVGTTTAIVLAGLVLGAIGDVALTYDGQRAFLAGLGAFLLGHLAYLAAGLRLDPDPGVAIGVGIALAAIGVVAWRWMASGIPEGLRTPVLVYVATIVATAAIAAGASAGTAPWTFGVGVALFLVSDLAVARETFVASTFANKLWGLPVYYAGQLLIAWSVGRLPA